MEGETPKAFRGSENKKLKEQGKLVRLLKLGYGDFA